MRRRIRDTLDYFARGLLMGTADIIPGVSGGTIALIVAVYERLIAAISELVSFGLNVLQADWAEAAQHGRAVDWRLLLPLGAGIGAALMLGARFIPGLMAQYPAQMRGLFFGLVAASLVIPWLRIEQSSLRLMGIAVGSAVIAFVLVGLPPRTVTEPGLLRVFGSAAVAICAMILPGVSGAFLLEVMGIYTPTLEALNAGNLPYVLTFMTGAACGLGLFAKLLNLFLRRFHDATMAALIGLIAGALRALWPYATAHGAPRWPTATEPVASVIALGLLGFVAVATLTWWGHRRVQNSAAQA